MENTIFWSINFERFPLKLDKCSDLQMFWSTSFNSIDANEKKEFSK